MKAGDKITTKEGVELIAVTTGDYAPCNGCYFDTNEGCAVVTKNLGIDCRDGNKNDLIFVAI